MDATSKLYNKINEILHPDGCHGAQPGSCSCPLLSDHFPRSLLRRHTFLFVQLMAGKNFRYFCVYCSNYMMLTLTRILKVLFSSNIFYDGETAGRDRITDWNIGIMYALNAIDINFKHHTSFTLPKQFVRENKIFRRLLKILLHFIVSIVCIKLFT